MPERRSKKAPDEERPLALPPPGPLPEVIYAQASPRSSGETSLFAMESIDVQNVGNFFADSDTTERAAAQLRAAGFDVLQVTPLTINIAGSADTYRRAFGIRLEAQERMVIKPGIGVTSAISTTSEPVSVFRSRLISAAIRSPQVQLLSPVRRGDASSWLIQASEQGKA